MKRAGAVRAVGAVAAVAALLPPQTSHAGSPVTGPTCAWMNTSKSPDVRAHELVRAMTLDQKIAELYNHATTGQWGAANVIPAVPTLCIPALVFNDGGAGVADNQVLTTAFPDPVAQAASWDPALQQRVGAAIGAEAWQKGVDVLLAPAVDIARNPLGGRNFEYAGEDPVLAGQTAAAFVRGVQSQHVVATVKHYAANDQETSRTTDSSDVDERTLEEIDLPAFAAAVDAGAGAVMCSYNRVNGTYACQNRQLLTTLLKGQLGFDGWVMSDWGATHSGVAAANAGLDQEQNTDYFASTLKAAVLSRRVPMARLDDMVFRIMRSLFRVGVFDHPPVAQPATFGLPVDLPAAQQAALTAAEDGAVLLKNNHRTLPLHGPGVRIAVIGRPAAPQGAQNAYQGGGSSHVPLQGADPDVVSPLQGMLTRAAAAGDVVTYADGSDPTTAATLAKQSDVAIVFASDGESEGHDRTSLALNDATCTLSGCTDPAGATPDATIAAVAAANHHTVVVLQSGGPVTMPWLSHVDSVLEMWYPGEADGTAAAALLFGDVDPSGKLPVTFPRALRDDPIRSVRQFPGIKDRAGVPHSAYLERLLVGYRWYDAKGIAPLFPFGFGLSYTTFGVSHLSVHRTSGAATVRVVLTDTGARAGADVVQVYVAAPPTAGEPPHTLAAYAKVSLQPHRSATVTLAVPARAFEQWDARTHRWVRAPGCYTLLVGDSSRSLPLAGRVCG